MSLRKSPQLTPALLDAARHNAQHCTGPHSATAKQNVKLNALKHGGRVRDENRCQAMQALGEDPERLQRLTEELMSAFGPGDALFEKQIEDLAWLYWRRDRLERAQEGLKRRALQAIDDWQHRRRQEMARVTFDASQHEMLNANLPQSTDRGVTLRKTLCLLQVIQDQFKQRTFRLRQLGVLEPLYTGVMGWREVLICSLLKRFCDAPNLAERQADEEDMQFLRKIGAPTELPGEPEYRELLRLFEEEIAGVREELEYAEKANQERAAIERDACLAPEGETWRMMLRQEAAIDRSIDRKVRILMRLRKEAANPPIPPAGQGDGPMVQSMEEMFDSDIMPERTEGAEAVENSKLNEQYGNVIENKGSRLEDRRRSGNLSGNKGSYAQNEGRLLKRKAVIVRVRDVWSPQRTINCAHHGGQGG